MLNTKQKPIMPSIYDYLTRDTSFALDSLLATMTREKRCRPIGESELPCRVTTDDRRKMIEWCYKIVEVTQLERENVAMVSRYFILENHINVLNSLLQIFSTTLFVGSADSYQAQGLLNNILMIKTSSSSSLLPHYTSPSK